MKDIIKATLIIGGILLFSLSLGGQTWSARQRLTWNSGNSSCPRMAITGSNRIHVFWHDHTFDHSEILNRNSTDRGDTWQSIARLTWDPSYSRLCDAAGYDNYMFIVWAEFSPGNYEIMFRRGNASTSNWDASKRVTWNSGDSSSPSICFSTKFDIFTTSILVHIVWEDDTTGNKEIYYRKGIYEKDSAFETFYWSTQKRLTWNTGTSVRPVVAVDPNQDIHVVWYDNTSGNYEICHKKSTDEGATWSGTRRLTWTSDSSFAPAMKIDSAGGIHIVWYDGPSGTISPYHRKGTDGGSTWSSRTRLSWNSASAPGISVTTDSANNIHVVYIDDHSGTDEIYYKQSTNGGTTWGSPQRLTWSTMQNFNPHIIADSSDGLHLVWDTSVCLPDSGGYTTEIFYKNKK